MVLPEITFYLLQDGCTRIAATLCAYKGGFPERVARKRSYASIWLKRAVRNDLWCSADYRDMMEATLYVRWG